LFYLTVGLFIHVVFLTLRVWKLTDLFEKLTAHLAQDSQPRAEK